MAPAPRTTAPRYAPEVRRFRSFLMAGRRDPERLFGTVRRDHQRRAWYVDVRPYGRIWSLEGEGFRSRRDAETLLRNIRARLSRGMSHEVAVAPFLPISNRVAKVATYYEAWLERRRRELEAGKLSHRTVAEYARYAREGGELDFWAAHTIYDVDAAALDDWALWLAAERKLSPKTIRNVLGAFRTFLHALERRGEIERAPVFPTVPLDQHVPRVLVIEDQARVLAAIPDAERGAHLICGTMGLRPSEVRALVRSDYTPARGPGLGRLRVVRARQGNAPDAPIGPTKTRRERILPTPDVVAAWIERHVPPAERLRAPDAPLCLNPRTGRPWSHWALRESWLRACRSAGVPAIGLYEGTKHTAASAMLERSGGNLEAVAKMLGHSDSRTTRRYAQVTEGVLVDLARGTPGSEETEEGRHEGE